MLFKTNPLCDAIKFTLTAVATAAAGAWPAFAQEQPDPTTLDRIEVTGSRIRQVDIETAAPVLMLQRVDIAKQGYKSVADILQNITTIGALETSRSIPLLTQGVVGSQSIDLRNLGATRTLILLNGKRLGASTDGFQDVSSIPAVMVERVEVLKDGASTIYGSDAIAGVINIITHKNSEGAEANVYYGQYDQGDGVRQAYDFMMGFNGERGSLTAAIEYSEEDPVFARNRWFSAAPLPLGEKLPPFPGGFSGVSQFGRFTFDTGRVNANGNPIVSNVTLRREEPGLDPRDLDSYRPTNATDVANTSDQLTVYSGIERKSAFLNGYYDITDWLKFEADVLYTDRETFGQAAGTGFQSANFERTSGGLSIDSFFNPVGNQAAGDLPEGVEPQAVQYTRRAFEVPRLIENSLTTYRFAGTFSGSFEIGDRPWDWDAGYLYNRDEGEQVNTGNLNTQRVALATGPSFLNTDGVVQCGTSGNPIPLGTGDGQCTPWNPLIPFGLEGQNSTADPAVQAYLFPTVKSLTETETTDYFVNLTGPLVTLPAGDLAIAVGYEHRKQEGSFTPDPLVQAGLTTDLSSSPTNGSYSLDEFYAELQIPILADVAFADELTVTLASRYSDYDTFGETINSKFGFKWKPIEDLLVRGTWAQGFRAPSISDLFGGLRSAQDRYTDPCDTLFGAAGGNARCLQDVPADFRQPNTANTGPALLTNEQSPFNFQVGANPDLTPETSTSKTLGIVWSPDFAKGLNLALDWWSVRIENTIIPDSITAVLEDCYLRLIESRCNAVTGTTFTRDPVTGVVLEATRTSINAGFQEVEGYDLEVSYSLPTDWGDFKLAWLSTYTSKNELKTDNLTENAPRQLNGTASEEFGANFRLRSNLNLSWEIGAFGVTWGMRYYSGVKERCANFEGAPCSVPNFTSPEFQGVIVPMNEVGSNTFHDVQVHWNTPWDATVAIGVNNVFEHYAAPMYSTPDSGFSYYGGFDIGRFTYLQYKQRF